MTKRSILFFLGLLLLHIPVGWTQTTSDELSCTFPLLHAGNCSLLDYCATLSAADEDADIICDGDVTGDWYIEEASTELCFVEPAGVGQPFSDNVTFSYCSRRSVFRNFTGSSLDVYEERETFTLPFEGLARAIEEVVACVNGSIANFEYGEVEYCRPDCFEFLLDKDACIFDCISCDDGSPVPDCSNLLGGIGDVHCQDETNFYGQILAYMEGQIEGEIDSFEDEDNQASVEDLPSAEDSSENSSEVNEGTAVPPTTEQSIEPVLIEPEAMTPTASPSTTATSTTVEEQPTGNEETPGTAKEPDEEEENTGSAVGAPTTPVSPTSGTPPRPRACLCGKSRWLMTFTFVLGFCTSLVSFPIP